jgi:DNA polymerase delta subunit 1
LNGADKISGVHVKNSNDEKEILRNFEKLMVSYDPDFITGYNMVNFDLWYILERARALKMSNYGFFGRSKGVISRIKNGTFQSKVMGNRDTK